MPLNSFRILKLFLKTASTLDLAKIYLSDLYKDCIEAKNKNEKFLRNKLLGDSSLITFLWK